MPWKCDKSERNRRKKCSKIKLCRFCFLSEIVLNIITQNNQMPIQNLLKWTANNQIIYWKCLFFLSISFKLNLSSSPVTFVLNSIWQSDLYINCTTRYRSPSFTIAIISIHYMKYLYTYMHIMKEEEKNTDINWPLNTYA